MVTWSEIICELGMKPRPSIVRSPAFRAWFGDSRAVDSSGKPWICYHGTRHDFQIFDVQKIGQTTDFGWFGDGIYLTPDPVQASIYASIDQRSGDLKPQGHVMPLYVRAAEPFVTEQATMSRSYVAEIIEDGHDAIFYYENSGDTLPKEIIVFKPNQVKSALANQAFSASDSISETTLITEAAYEDANLNDDWTVRLWRNPPNRARFDKIIASTDYKEIRGVAIETAVWIWDAYAASHDDIIKYLHNSGINGSLIPFTIASEPRGLNSYFANRDAKSFPCVARMLG